jgi:hypothetical protein
MFSILSRAIHKGSCIHEQYTSPAIQIDKVAFILRQKFCWLAIGAVLAFQAGADDVALIAELAPNIRPSVIEEAVSAMQCAQSRGVGVDARRLAIIDYTIPSSEKRMWVVDLEAQRLLFEEYVAHGQKSGPDIPTAFSDRNGSHQTSLGLFFTDATYQGGNGYSLKMHGLSKGFNESAMRRKIVMHGAAYVNPRAAVSMGRLGRSWGCPAVRVEVAKPMIDALKEGNFIYSHGPGTAPLSRCGTESLALTSLVN